MTQVFFLRGYQVVLRCVRKPLRFLRPLSVYGASFIYLKGS